MIIIWYTKGAIVVIINSSKCNDYIEEHLVLYLCNIRSHKKGNTYMKCSHILLYGAIQVQKVLYRVVGTIFLTK